jgi:methionine-rich copper-binding protein CopC
LSALAPLALLVFAALAAPAVALAAANPTPASLVSASPGANTVQSKAPSSVTLTFSENVAQSGSNITIQDAKGNTVSTGSTTAKGETLSVGMHGNGNGTYLVVWHATSATGNKPSVGAYTFAVGAASNPANEFGSTSASPPPAGISPWVAVLTAFLGLIVGAAGAIRFRGMSAPSARPSARPARPARSSSTDDK